MASRQNRSEVALCINLVHELQELIIGSRRAFISGNACVVDRQSMLDKLNELEHSLPEAVRQAHESLKTLDAHQEQVEEECRVKVNEANQKAQQILASAKKTEEEAQQKAASVASAAAAAAAENQRQERGGSQVLRGGRTGRSHAYCGRGAAACGRLGFQGGDCAPCPRGSEGNAGECAGAAGQRAQKHL